jgi:hypothetical protein
MGYETFDDVENIQYYKKNTCILKDNTTNIIEIEPDIPKLIDNGYLLFRMFLSNSLD